MVSTQWNGNGVEGAVGEAVERGVLMACEALMANALDRTPFAEGDLRQSAMASAEGTRGVVSYNTPYAVRQHEDVSLNHPNGGEAKFLEKAVNDFGAEFLDIVKASIAGAL
ncbi:MULTISPECIES: hypothetical protein [Rhodococcus]|uniref:hypothetical protein n=1 Tax=Rhodococcus TaxID=1827 RepID=UPI000C7B080C|nr:MULTISPECIES: hypothetical protein [Rhodococcus]AUM18230.1 hypothetical protein CSW53_17880 [Rhodococcus ruber]